MWTLRIWCGFACLERRILRPFTTRNRCDVLAWPFERMLSSDNWRVKWKTADEFIIDWNDKTSVLCTNQRILSPICGGIYCTDVRIDLKIFTGIDSPKKTVSFHFFELFLEFSFLTPRLSDLFFFNKRLSARVLVEFYSFLYLTLETKHVY